MDIVYIKDLSADTVIGVFPWERQIKQTLRFDLELAVDCAVPAASDELSDALDYGAVSRSVREFVARSEFTLIETLAEQVAERVMSEFGVPWVRIRVTKRALLPGVGAVGVAIERGHR
jgi:dihydroneopterin aldolase